MDRPLKTFIEISSGQLIPGDRILFLLPKAVEIISEPVLARHAGQMTQDRLNQFLRTAMINKLDRGGAIVVDIEEAPAQPALSSQAHKILKKSSRLKRYFLKLPSKRNAMKALLLHLRKNSLIKTPPRSIRNTLTRKQAISIFRVTKKNPLPSRLVSPSILNHSSILAKR